VSKPKLAYGVEPSKAAFPLRLARYKGLAEDIAAWVRAHPEKRPLRLLDLGLGSGRSLRFLEAEGVAGEIAFFGLDVSPARLARARERDEWRLCRGTLTAPLPFAAASADICVCEQVIEHLDDPDLVLREIRRVLRPDGLLVLGVPNFPAPVIPLHRAFTRLRRRLVPDGHFHVQSFSAHTLRIGVERAGFSVRDLRGFRLTSGGITRPLEQRAWWYRANRRFGARFPALCIEVQVLATRNV
jgi:SAM-dependent methyltransferase